MFEEFDALIAQGDWSGAQAVAFQLIENQPDAARPRNLMGVVLTMQGQHVAAVQWYEQACALEADADKYHRNLGLAYLETRNLTRAKQAFEQAAVLSGMQRGGVNVFRSSLLDERMAALGVPYVKQLDDVRVDTAYWTLMKGNVLYSEDVVSLNLNNSPFVEGLSQDGSLVVADVPTPEQLILRPCVFLGGDYNFSHWLTRYLPRLAAIQENESLRAMPLLTKDNLRGYEIESLAALGYDRKDLLCVPLGTCVQVRELHVPSFPRPDIAAMGRTLQWLRSRMLDAMASGRPERTRLFVSRRDAVRRRLLTEDAVLEALKPFGIEVIVPGEMTFAEQVEIFSRAELVVGPHGAGLTNIAFSPSDCAVVEITSPTTEQMIDIQAIAEIMGQRMQLVWADESASQQIDDDERPVYPELVADPAAVAQAVHELMNG